ncbi:hypothetical protein VTL71DRAFT_2571 [Oculimacula yallundae]|uniref:Aminoglycoside phosphotransferase domain-containing protein n=1 Tax=Oculimacula yallundae TaxID=86028 RepID=A0ABR4C9B6_9HELO
MTPPIGKSVCRLTPKSWMLGSSIICERITALVPPNAIASWQDNDNTFYLRERIDEDLSSPKDDFETGKIHEAGTSAAVWTTSPSIFCKVKAWVEGMELESDTIAFVKSNAPEIPVPEVVHTWIDRSWNRTFLLLRRVEGKTLDEQWTRFSLDQRRQIANEVVGFCCRLALITSSRFETATGRGVVEPFLNSTAEASHPSWKPRLIGSFSAESFHTHLSFLAPASHLISTLNTGNRFHFYHADLGPTNIMVSDRGTVTGILDWESAAYYPSFWIVVKVGISADFLLQRDRTDPRAWGVILREGFQKAGFEEGEGWVEWWRKKRGGK